MGWRTGAERDSGNTGVRTGPLSVLPALLAGSITGLELIAANEEQRQGNDNAKGARGRGDVGYQLARGTASNRMQRTVRIGLGRPFRAHPLFNGDRVPGAPGALPRAGISRPFGAADEHCGDEHHPACPLPRRECAQTWSRTAEEPAVARWSPARALQL